MEQGRNECGLEERAAPIVFTNEKMRPHAYPMQLNVLENIYFNPTYQKASNESHASQMCFSSLNNNKNNLTKDSSVFVAASSQDKNDIVDVKQLQNGSDCSTVHERIIPIRILHVKKDDAILQDAQDSRNSKKIACRIPLVSISPSSNMLKTFSNQDEQTKANNNFPSAKTSNFSSIDEHPSVFSSDRNISRMFASHVPGKAYNGFSSGGEAFSLKEPTVVHAIKILSERANKCKRKYETNGSEVVKGFSNLDITKNSNNNMAVQFGDAYSHVRKEPESKNVEFVLKKQETCSFLSNPNDIKLNKVRTTSKSASDFVDLFPSAPTSVSNLVKSADNVSPIETVITDSFEIEHLQRGDAINCNITHPERHTYSVKSEKRVTFPEKLEDMIQVIHFISAKNSNTLECKRTGNKQFSSPHKTCNSPKRESESHKLSSSKFSIMTSQKREKKSQKMSHYVIHHDQQLQNVNNELKAKTKHGKNNKEGNIKTECDIVEGKVLSSRKKYQTKYSQRSKSARPLGISRSLVQEIKLNSRPFSSTFINQPNVKLDSSKPYVDVSIDGHSSARKWKSDIVRGSTSNTLSVPRNIEVKAQIISKAKSAQAWVSPPQITHKSLVVTGLCMDPSRPNLETSFLSRSAFRSDISTQD